MTTIAQPASTSMPAEISPVKAPDPSQYTSWAPRRTAEPFKTAPTAAIAVNGTQTAASPEADAAASRTAEARSTDWARFRFIFQFPARRGRRAGWVIVANPWRRGIVDISSTFLFPRPNHDYCNSGGGPKSTNPKP